MRFTLVSTLLFLLILPIRLSGQIVDTANITSYIQNAIYAEQYDLLEKFSTREWYEENYDLKNSREIYNLSILSTVMDTIEYPEILETEKIYVVCWVPDEYETIQKNQKTERQLIRTSRLTEWKGIGCHRGRYVHWDNELIKEVQKKLITEKWLVGPINGELNKQTLLGFKFYNALKLNNRSNESFCLFHPNIMIDRSSIFNFLRLDKHMGMMGFTIRQVQKALLDKGYSPGEITNTLNVETKKAITQFQRDHQLKKGQLDFPTLRELGIYKSNKN